MTLSTANIQLSLFGQSYKLSDKDNALQFLDSVSKFGIKQLSKIPFSILENESLVKKLIKIDPYTLMYLSDYFHKDEFFMEINKNYEILLMNPLNKKINENTVNWLINNSNDYVYVDFLKNPHDFLKNDLLKEKIGIGFLIKNAKVPNYLKNYVDKYKDKTVNELIEIQKAMLTYEQMNLFLEEKKVLEIRTKI